MEGIIFPVVVVSVVGLLAGLMLTVASKYMAVEVDERVANVRAVLPGSNCGACGFAGCEVYAEKLVDGSTRSNLCTPGGSAVAGEIAGALGIAAEDVRPMTAVVKCAGTCEKTDYSVDYQGTPTCVSCALLYRGRGQCAYSCLGFGDCVPACTSGAIYIVNGIPVIDKEKCNGCTMCVKACPKSLIEVVPSDKIYYVSCSSNDKGGVTRKLCTAGCIGCKKCEKKCETGAVTVDKNLARIDPEKCVICGKCSEEGLCSSKAIKMI